MRDFANMVTGEGSGLPSRIMLHGVEGIGKTSFGAAAPTPIILQAQGETGLETLIDAGQLPATDHFPEMRSWADILGSLDWLSTGKHEFKTLVIDTVNGIQQSAFDYIIQRDYKGDPKQFAAYARGKVPFAQEWRRFLNSLDRVRRAKMSILLLAHTDVVAYKNPEGEDYDRYIPQMMDVAWKLTVKWCDAVLFALYDVQVKDRTGTNENRQRTIHTQECPAWVAKNRFGLPESIPMGNSGVEAWGNFISALKGAKNG